MFSDAIWVRKGKIFTPNLKIPASSSKNLIIYYSPFGPIGLRFVPTALLKPHQAGLLNMKNKLLPTEVSHFVRFMAIKIFFFLYSLQTMSLKALLEMYHSVIYDFCSFLYAFFFSCIFTASPLATTYATPIKNWPAANNLF